MKKDIQYYSFIEGCYLGIVFCLLTIIAYSIDTKLLLPTTNLYSVSFLIAQFSFAFYSVKKSYVKFNVTRYDFKYYFSICFLLLCVALFFSSVLFYFLYNVFNSNLISDFISFEYSKCTQLTSCNMSIDDFYQTYLGDYFSMYGQFQAYVFSLIPCTLYSAIISLLMKIQHK
ncbi:MAG: hypothetical protein CMD26_02495 [Flavobacteriales bacterium]|nr:hypothetical protein [Flavobacteriales bacterium]